MLRHVLFSSALFIMATASAASAWMSRYGMVVNQTSATTFDVPYRGVGGPSVFWCAAGEFVRYKLHKPGNTRIYRTSPVPRRPGEGMSFSLLPDGAQPSGLFIVGGSKGVSASHAILLCEDFTRRSDD